MKSKTKVKTKELELTRTKIFAYKGYVGIQSGPKVGGMIAKPEGGNIGTTVNADYTDVSAEAIELLKKVRKISGSFADIMIFKAGPMVCIGWIGGYLNVFKPEEVEGDRDYDPSLLKVFDGTVEIPQEFKELVDKQS